MTHARPPETRSGGRRAPVVALPARKRRAVDRDWLFTGLIAALIAVTAIIAGIIVELARSGLPL